MGRTLFRRKNIVENVKTDETRITALEVTTNAAANVVPGTTTSDLAFQFQATHFSKCRGQGDARIWINAATSAINEETEATVAIYSEFNDLGGNAEGSNDVFDATLKRVPVFDNEGKVGYYRGHPTFITWETFHPEVVHTKKFMTGHCAELNVPGTNVNDTKSFIYYDSNAAYNVSTNISMCVWFYPTDVSTIASETYRVLFYRRIDASNSFMIMIKPSDQKVYVFVNEAAATTKLASSATVTLGAWNLIVFTYNPTTNALVIYLNNSSSSTTPADALPAPYTTDANMYLGGLPGLPDKRYTGYLDTFVFWTGKILTSTEAGNMWNHGTIV